MLARNILPNLNAALGDTPVVLLQGARQTGKTTLAKTLTSQKPPRRYLTLDDPTILSSAVSNAVGFVKELDQPVIIDEAQRASALYLAIKADVDRDRTPGRFLLTGSANVLFVPKVSESLAGRIELITLWPLSQGEIEGRSEKFIDAVFQPKLPSPHLSAPNGENLLERIVRGGYPEPIMRPGPQRRSAWYASYLTTILHRDVRDLANIEGLTDFPRLLALIASRTSGLLNLSDLSRSLSMPQSTLKRYFALLEATFLVLTIPAWSNNQGVKLTKAPKIMLADTGLACHVLGMDHDRLKADGNARGSLLENFVAMELIKQAGWSTVRTRLFHYRTAAGREADLVLEDAAGRLVGIEVKSAAAVGASDFSGLRSLHESSGTKFVRGIVLYDGTDVVPFDKDLVAMPLSAIWRL
jgi:predicted AAA+ superfamily ATPase